jgi:hypothetical protein
MIFPMNFIVLLLEQFIKFMSLALIELRLKISQTSYPVDQNLPQRLSRIKVKSGY